MKLYNVGKTKLIDFNLTGNIIPPSWYRHIKRGNGKPYSIAIELLGDIVWWYRPLEDRDEKTGEPTGMTKKFMADKLQRAYKDFALYYGYTKDQVRDALTCLEKLGLIDRDFRSIINKGTKSTNVLYIGLNIKKVKKISYTLSAKNQIGSQETIREAPPKEPDTNTGDHPEINNNDIGFSEVIKTYQSLTGTINPFISEQLGVIYDELLVHIVALPVSHPDANKSPSELLVAAIVHMGKYADRPSIAYLEKVVDGWKRHGVGSKPPGKRTNNRKPARQKTILPEGMDAADLEKAEAKS